MDLLGLPEEMLAIVFKYASFETLTRMRKLNQKVDRTSCRYGVNKPSVESVYLCKGDVSICFFNKNIFDAKKMWKKDIKNDTDNRLILFDKYLKKVRCQLIEIEEILIDKELLNILSQFKAAERRNHHIVFIDCDLTVPLDEYRNLLAKFSQCDLDISNWNTTVGGSYRNEKVIVPLLSVVNELLIQEEYVLSTPAADITDDTLRALRKFKPSAFSLRSTVCYFSVEELLKTITTFLELGAVGQVVWNLGEVKINSIDQLKRTIEVLQTNPTTEIEHIDDDETKVIIMGAVSVNLF